MSNEPKPEEVAADEVQKSVQGFVKWFGGLSMRRKLLVTGFILLTGGGGAGLGTYQGCQGDVGLDSLKADVAALKSQVHVLEQHRTDDRELMLQARNAADRLLVPIEVLTKELGNIKEDAKGRDLRLREIEKVLQSHQLKLEYMEREVGELKRKRGR